MTEFSHNCGTAKWGHRALYKATTPPWKETIRQRCYTKFQKARERLVDAFRDLPSLNEMKQKSQGLMDEVMDQEWRELFEKMPELGRLNHHEMCLLEEEMRQELRSEQESQEEEYYQSLLQLQTEETNQLADNFDKVLCPICKKDYFNERDSVISCFCGTFLYDRRQEFSLARLSADLDASLDHHAMHCDKTPTFSTISDKTMGKSSLRIYCRACKFEHCLP